MIFCGTNKKRTGRWLVLFSACFRKLPPAAAERGAGGYPCTSPGQRIPQGPGVSVPDCRAGPPAIPRRRQEVRIHADRPAEAFFLLDRPRPVLFLPPCKKRMGGGNAQLASQLIPPSNGTHPPGGFPQTEKGGLRPPSVFTVPPWGPRCQKSSSRWPPAPPAPGARWG